MEILIIVFALIALTLLALAVPRWGFDSRDGRDWKLGPEDGCLPHQHHA